MYNRVQCFRLCNKLNTVPVETRQALTNLEFTQKQTILKRKALKEINKPIMRIEPLDTILTKILHEKISTCQIS